MVSEVGFSALHCQHIAACKSSRVPNMCSRGPLPLRIGGKPGFALPIAIVSHLRPLRNVSLDVGIHTISFHILIKYERINPAANSQSGHFARLMCRSWECAVGGQALNAVGFELYIIQKEHTIYYTQLNLLHWFLVVLRLATVSRGQRSSLSQPGTLRRWVILLEVWSVLEDTSYSWIASTGHFTVKARSLSLLARNKPA